MPEEDVLEEPVCLDAIGEVAVRGSRRFLLGPTLRCVARGESIVLLNTGHGKGKSSAAFGVMARGWARGWRVGVVQFIKGGKWKTGERKLADHLGIEWHTLGDGFTWESTDLDETAAKGRHAWDVAAGKLASGDYDLLILDELTYAVKYEWVPVVVSHADPIKAAIAHYTGVHLDLFQRIIVSPASVTAPRGRTSS